MSDGDEYCTNTISQILRIHNIHSLTPYQRGILLFYKSLNTCGLIQIALLFFFLHRLILLFRFFLFVSSCYFP